MNNKTVVDYDDVVPNAPFTSNEPKETPRLKYRFGRRVISIPLSEDSLNEITIQKYLPRILLTHCLNADDCKHFEKVYKGDTHIFDKIRKINPDKKNSIINENHAFYMVEFKKGFMFGNPLKYSCSDDSVSTDDITYLNKYIVNQKKPSKDIENGETIFKCGNSYRMVLPKPYSPARNLEKEAPFKITNLDNKTTFVVYSSNFEKEKLFGGIITTLDSPDPDNVKYEIMIYTKTHTYRFRCWSLTPTWEGVDFINKKEHLLGLIPIVEYYTNTARLGIIDILETIYDAINDISSDSIDAVNDYVNSILAIYNMEIDENTKKEVEDNKAISLKTIDPSRPADAKYLVNALDQTDVMVRYEKLIKVAYDIAGVPMPTTQTTSGGDTGDARELGGGWESANTIASQNEEPLKQGEQILLDIILTICKKMPNCPIDEIYTSDIEINFNRTSRNNLMVKAQVLTYLIDRGLPEETVLNITELCGNTHEVAMAWIENKKRLKEESIQTSNTATLNDGGDDPPQEK